jgi:hypothetical protein
MFMHFVDSQGKKHLLDTNAKGWQICWDTTSGKICIFNGTGCQVSPSYETYETRQMLPEQADNPTTFSAYAKAIAGSFDRKVERIGNTFAYRIV